MGLWLISDCALGSSEAVVSFIVLKQFWRIACHSVGFL